MMHEDYACTVVSSNEWATRSRSRHRCRLYMAQSAEGREDLYGDIERDIVRMLGQRSMGCVMYRSSAGRRASALIALIAAIAVGGCEAGAEDAPAPAQTAAPSPDAAVATTGGEEANYPTWLGIDPELVEEHLASLEGREPPAGFTGAPGWDMEWCMDQLGWEVISDARGEGFEYEGVADQQVAMDSAIEACSEFLGLQDQDPFTEEFLALSYDNKREVADCLRSMGFDVEDPPSREVYIEQTIAERFSVWNVHEHVPDNRWSAVEEQCPGKPGWEIFAEIGQ